MKRFSEREGYRAFKDKKQIESMDEELRNGLWNALIKFYFIFSLKTKILDQLYITRLDEGVKPLIDFIWIDYFKKPIDEMRGILGNIYDEIRDYYFKCEWYEVYDFIEFIANNNLRYYNTEERYKTINEAFIEECNKILEREASGYRFIHKIIVKITSNIEIKEIEEPEEVGGFGSKGVGEIGLVPTAGAVAGALYQYDGKWRFELPIARK